MKKKNKERLFTSEEMFLFSGYLMGKKLLDPFVDVTEVFNEWKKEFNIEKETDKKPL